MWLDLKVEFFCIAATAWISITQLNYTVSFTEVWRANNEMIAESGGMTSAHIKMISPEFRLNMWYLLSFCWVYTRILSTMNTNLFCFLLGKMEKGGLEVTSNPMEDINSQYQTLCYT